MCRIIIEKLFQLVLQNKFFKVKIDQILLKIDYVTKILSILIILSIEKYM